MNDVYCNIVEGFNPKDAGGTVRATSSMGYRQDGISQWQKRMQPCTMNLHFKRRRRPRKRTVLKKVIKPSLISSSFCLWHSEKEETQAMFSWGSWGDPALLFRTVYCVHWIKKDLVPLVWAHLREKLFWIVHITTIQLTQIELLTFPFYLSLPKTIGLYYWSSEEKLYFYAALPRCHVNVICWFILTSQTPQSLRPLNQNLRALPLRPCHLPTLLAY